MPKCVLEYSRFDYWQLETQNRRVKESCQVLIWLRVYVDSLRQELIELGIDQYTYKVCRWNANPEVDITYANYREIRSTCES